MELHSLRPAKGATKKAKRIGRGEASGKGGTSTKGNKGGQSRAGYKSKMAQFENSFNSLIHRVIEQFANYYASSTTLIR